LATVCIYASLSEDGTCICFNDHRLIT